jgi:hypothetical protein
MRRLLSALWIVAVGLWVSSARAQGAGLIQLRNDLGGTPAKPEVVGLLNLALPALSGSGCLDYNGTGWVLASCSGGGGSITLTGDTTGTGTGTIATTTGAENGFAFATTTPTGNQVMMWSSGTSKWTPTSLTLSLIPAPTGTGVALLSGGAWVAAAGTVNLASSTYVSGILGVANGGTADSTLTLHSVLIGEGTGAIAFAGPSASTGLPLLSSGSSADPTFGQLSLTTATGAVTGILPAPNGGTGVASPTAHDVPVAEGASAFTFISPSTSGFLLESNGTSADPSFQAQTTITQVGTLTSGSLGSGFTLNLSLPTISNTLGVANGGTASSTLTAHAVLLGEGTSALGFAGPSATSGQPLLSAGSSTDPAFSALMQLTAASTDFLKLGTTPSATGFVRTSNASTLLTSRNAANSADISVAATDSSNDVGLGDGTNGGHLTLSAGSGDFVKIFAGSTLELQCGAFTGGGGAGCYAGGVTPGNSNYAFFLNSAGTSFNPNVAAGGVFTVTIAGATAGFSVTSTGALTFNQYGAHHIMVSEGASAAASIVPPSTSGIPVISNGSSSDPGYGTAVVAGGGTGATTQNTNGAAYYNGSIITTTTGFSANHQFLEYNGSTLGPYTPSWHISTFCSAACTFTTSGSTYTPVTNRLSVDACGAGGGGGAGPNGTSSAGIGNPPDGGGGGGAAGPYGHWSVGVTAGTAVTVNFQTSGGVGGTVASPTANNGATGGTSSIVQSSSTIWSLFGGAGGTGGHQGNGSLPPYAAGGSATTGAASYGATLSFAVPPQHAGSGGEGGGKDTSGNIVQAYGGADAMACAASVSNCEGGAAGGQGGGGGNGGFGGGGGGGSYQSPGDAGDTGGVGVSSGTGGNATQSGNNGGLCAGGGAGAAGGASQTGTGGNGSPGHAGGGSWISISEWYRWLSLDPANDNARPWKTWAREVKRASNF